MSLIVFPFTDLAVGGNVRSIMSAPAALWTDDDLLMFPMCSAELALNDCKVYIVTRLLPHLMPLVGFESDNIDKSLIRLSLRTYSNRFEPEWRSGNASHL